LAREDLAAIFIASPARLGIRIVRTDATLRRDYFGTRTISDERNDLEQMFLGTRAGARGGVGFSDRGISGFRAGHSRRNEVHEEAQT
jgi:hypothetical protein